MKRRTFIKLAGGGVVLAATGAGATRWSETHVFGVPSEALEGWGGPKTGMDLRESLLSYAILAPNPHNMQPWIADLSGPDQISIRHDTSRLLPETDPHSRQILLGLGCFLELLSMAAADRGMRADIDLFPEGMPGEYLDGRRAARISLVPEGSAAPDPLFAHVLQRRTDRREYHMAHMVTDRQVEVLTRAAGGYPVQAGILRDKARVDRVREIAVQAMMTELATEGAFMESMKVLRLGTKEIGAHRDGISLTDPLPIIMAKLGVFDRSVMPESDSMAVQSQVEDFRRELSATNAYLWIVSDDNSRAAQVAAGRAYVRMNLAATGLGLSMHPNQQALQEYPEVAQSYRAIHGVLAQKGQTVQMLARIGVPVEGSALPPSPRRALPDFLA